MEKIKETFRHGKNLIIVRRLGTERHLLFALKDINDSVMTNMRGVVKVADKFYTELYSDQSEQEDRKGK